MAYVPGDLARLETLADVKEFLDRELAQIAQELTRIDHRKDVLYAEPTRPRNGMIVYADGTEWDPGAGEGFYGYEAGAWVKL